MKNLISIFVLVLALTGSASAQLVTLTQTTLSAAVGEITNTIKVASASGISAPSIANGTNGSFLYVLDPGSSRGEVMRVTAVSGTNISVQRGLAGTLQSGHISGAIVVIGKGSDFRDYDPSGSCVTATTTVTPWINTRTGAQWLCSTVTTTWVPGWNNPADKAATATVASAAGAILPSGPLFTVSGTAAVTGFTIPVGFNGGSFCVVPTGAFTWTTAGNINTAGTAVVGRLLCFTYSQTPGKFVASYL